jgi:geranylgeranyl reductase family protein
VTDHASSEAPLHTEVLVIGGGPAGAAAGYWLARHGHDVTVVERKTFPRDKTCGDGLTPRAVHQLDEMGLAEPLAKYHRYSGLRATGMGRSLELEWPSHPVYPQHGYVVRRRELDQLVAENAQRAGATLLLGHEALQPIVERGFVRGATVATNGATREVHAKYVVVADGANSRFGRSLGTFRTREWPYGTAIRTYWQSPRHAEPWIESALDVKDRNGNPMPGYGWIFPVGDGTVNIGVGLLAFRTSRAQHHTPARRLCTSGGRALGDRSRQPRVQGHQRAHPHGRLGGAQRRAQLPGGGRCRRQREPVQR